MIVIALLHNKTLVSIDHDNRKMIHLPTSYYNIPEHYSDITMMEIESYLYENTCRYDKCELFVFEP